MPSDAENIIDLYRRHADAWVRLRDKSVFNGKWLDAFWNLQSPTPHILDIGCGSGEPNARYFLEKGATVTGVDTSPELIDVARTRIGQGTWVVSDMRTLDLGTTFSGVLAWNSSFHLTPEDQRRLFPVFQKHAAPNAALMFTTGTSHGEAIGEFQGEPLYHGSLAPEEFRSLLDQHGFDLIDHVVEDPECGQQTVWLARYRS